MATGLVLAPMLAVACFDTPAPLGHRLAEAPGAGGTGAEGGSSSSSAGSGGGSAGGGGGGASGTGMGAAAGAAGASGSGASDGGGGMPASAPQRVCVGLSDTACARAENIAAGSSHTCVSMSDGTVRCWGNNDSHQFGNPDTPQGVFGSTTVVAQLRFPRSVVLGVVHSCAIGASGAAWCWGGNAQGQLGTGDRVFYSAPVLVRDAAIELSTSGATCALSADGTVDCWGILLNGQAWNGDEYAAFSTQPTPVQLPSPAVALAVASRHACAIIDEGNNVVCWGRGVDGRLGNGAFDNSGVPVSVTAIETPVRRIDASAEQTCVIAGTPAVVQCWGFSVGGNRSVPTTLDPQPDGEVVDVQVGWRHACALLKSGRVQCWGRNGAGVLGHEGPDTSVPSDVAGVSDAVELAVGYNHNCVVNKDASVMCWGDNYLGQLGVPMLVNDSSVPVTINLEVAQ